MKMVTFITTSLPYNGGESATFEDAYADELIRKGLAFDPEKKQEEPEPAPPVPPPIQPATLEQLIEEVKAAGYEQEAAVSIAKKRAAGEHGEVAKYLAGQAPIEAVREDLGDMTKAEIVKAALAEYELDLDEGKKKDELVEAFLAARAAKLAADEAGSRKLEAGS